MAEYYMVVLAKWLDFSFPDITGKTLEEFYHSEEYTSYLEIVDAAALKTVQRVIDNSVQWFYTFDCNFSDLLETSKYKALYNSYSTFYFPHLGGDGKVCKYRGFPINNAVSFRNMSDEQGKPFILIAAPVKEYYPKLDDIGVRVLCDSISAKYPESQRSEHLRKFMVYVGEFTKYGNKTAEENVAETAVGAINSSDEFPFLIEKVEGKPFLPAEALEVLKKVYTDFDEMPKRDEKEIPSGWAAYAGKSNPEGKELQRIRVEAGRQPQALITIENGRPFLVGWSDSGNQKRLWCKHTGNKTNFRFFFMK